MREEVGIVFSIQLVNLSKELSLFGSHGTNVVVSEDVQSHDVDGK